MNSFGPEARLGRPGPSPATACSAHDIGLEDFHGGIFA